MLQKITVARFENKSIIYEMIYDDITMLVDKIECINQSAKTSSANIKTVTKADSILNSAKSVLIAEKTDPIKVNIVNDEKGNFFALAMEMNFNCPEV